MRVSIEDQADCLLSVLKHYKQPEHETFSIACCVAGSLAAQWAHNEQGLVITSPDWQAISALLLELSERVATDGRDPEWQRHSRLRDYLDSQADRETS